MDMESSFSDSSGSNCSAMALAFQMGACNKIVNINSAACMSNNVITGESLNFNNGSTNAHLPTTPEDVEMNE